MAFIEHLLHVGYSVRDDLDQPSPSPWAGDLCPILQREKLETICPKSLQGYQSHSLDHQPARPDWSGGLNCVTLQMDRLKLREGKGFAQHTRAPAASGIVLGPCFLEPRLAWPGCVIWAE